MRYLPQILRRLFQPVPLMDAPHESDPITRDVDAAITAHEDASRIEIAGYSQIREAMDQLLERIGSQH